MEESRYMQQAAEMLLSVHLRALTIEERREKAIELASLMMSEARRIQTHQERTVQQMLSAMMEDPAGKIFTTSFTDQCFRTKRSNRLLDQLLYLIKRLGVPSFLPFKNKLGLYLFKYLGASRFSTFFVPLLRYFVRKECERVILPAERAPYLRHMKKRRKENIRINLNHLGEAILGEKEAHKRLQLYLNDLASVEVEYISVKISTLFSQINLLAFDKTIESLAIPLRRLYRAARDHFYVDAKGERRSKFVNLDMEEYRDLRLTVALFKHVLSEPEFFHHSAGIVLQSYLPDSYLIQRELTLWAMQRFAAGGAPIKIRIVKGANLAMEQVDAALHGWPQAPYTYKTDVDANFKRMVSEACKKEHAQAVHIGIGSHNLFDIAYALLLRRENGVEKEVDFEMLEGMADHLRRVVQALAGDLLLYCPIAKESEFQNAIAYLVRRLDENTAPDNFLRHSFDLIPNTREWHQQASLFSIACHASNSLAFASRRTQNRLLKPKKPLFEAPFENESDTDWSLDSNAKWGLQLLKEWKEKKHSPIPLVVGGEEKMSSLAKGIDPSYPSSVLYEFSQAQEKEIELALKSAQAAQKEFEKIPLKERCALLADIAQQLRCERANLIGAMVADGAKTVFEADLEVCEAIDFVEYYRKQAHEMHAHADLKWSARGIVVVASPWNFPVAIPCSGIAAALAAGNSVILKPAPECVLAAYVLANCFWKAGVSRSLLQFVSCEDEPYAQKLVSDPRVNAVILTGGSATARYLLEKHPQMHLLAETGGKNAIIITSMADRDQAVRDLVQSAFSHAGQKCSAASLVILEEELYEDTAFREQIKDAVQSLKVGVAWEAATKINPLIKPPNDLLKRALTELDEGEEWLVEPKQDPHHPHLWSAGVKLGVKEGSHSHQIEFFGPVLSVMKAANLEEALRLANGTPYGLTAGLYSLDEREHEIWAQKMEAGNLYINRTITGAIVQRQPFGGYKQSCFGSHAKAGGPNYLMQLMRAQQIGLPSKFDKVGAGVAHLSHHLEKHFKGPLLEKWKAAIGSYAYYWNTHFSLRHDPVRLEGEDNYFYYKPYSKILLRLNPQDTFFDAMFVAAAALSAGVGLEISTPMEWEQREWEQVPGVTIKREAEGSFIQRLTSVDYLRLLSEPSLPLMQKARALGISPIIAPVLVNGRFELHHFVQEISLSISYHRYGNLGEREKEKRKKLEIDA